MDHLQDCVGKWEVNAAIGAMLVGCIKNTPFVEIFIHLF